MVQTARFRLPALALGVALAFSGCSSEDNANTMMTDAEGKPTKVENEGAPKTINSSSAAKSSTSQDPFKTKGYRKN